MNKLFFTTGVMLMLYSLVNAQQFQVIQMQGIVIEDDTENPIDYVVCYLKANDHIGDVTDSNGRFTLKFPQQFLSDTLSIYLLGYERLELPLSSLDLSQDTLLFKLERKSFLLDDIVVRAEGFDMHQLMINALKEIPKNYPNKKHQLTGFYRKVSTEDNLYTYLEEAVIKMDDYSYKRPPFDLRYRVEAIRRTPDWGNVDTFYTKIKRKMGEKFGTPMNSIVRNYYHNFIHHHTQNATHFNFSKRYEKLIRENHELKLMDVIVTDEDTIFQIAYSSGPPNPGPPSGLTYWKINKSDLAIIEFQITIGSKESYLLSQTLVRYQKVNGRYYPQFIKHIHPRYINRDGGDNELDIETIWIDEIKTDGYKRIEVKEMLDPMDTEKYKNVTYDSAFWHQLDLLQKHPIEKYIKSGLQIHRPLEEQFINHE